MSNLTSTQAALADAWAGALGTDQGLTLKCGCASCMKAAGYKAGDGLLPPDGVGGDLKDVGIVLPLSTLDVAGSNSFDTTTSVIEVDGANIVATIDSIGDRDFYRVELVAGQTYNIGMYQTMGTPPDQSGIPLADAFVEIYDSEGNLITSADGGGPNTQSGLDALLTFLAEESGVYYINAQAFDNAPEDGTNGEGVGDYELFVDTADAATLPFRYDLDSPLHGIDWGGATITNTSRNPDGDEGPRPRGFDESPGGLTGGGEDGSDRGNVGTVTGIAGKNVITYYFAQTGDVFLSRDPTTPGVTADIVQTLPIADFEKAAYRSAFQQYENVADVVFVEVFDVEEAYFKIITYPGTPGPGASLLGRASPPGEESEGQMEYNAADERYTEAGLTQGGFFYATLLHEIGHAAGLAHPHDTGGGSSVMRGAGGGTGGIGGATGDFDLSQQVFTIMSYNDGWTLSPYGQADDASPFGWVGTLSPFDIAVMQDKYGVNEDFNTGNNVYTLKDVNAEGTFYQTIWDGGGKDTLQYLGDRDALIDLRAATLEYEDGGGSQVSYATGVFGGFTIANGVTIEIATTGSGDDSITGNNANNTVKAGAGDDVISGREGGDRLYGEAGDDELSGDFGNDLLVGGDGADLLDGGGAVDILEGGAGADTLVGGMGKDQLRGGVDTDADVFLFTRAAQSTAGRDGRDVISDFVSGVDKIDLSIFKIDASDIRFDVRNPGAVLVLVDTDDDGQFDDFGLQFNGLNGAPVIEDFIL